MEKNIVKKIDDLIKIKTVLVSVSDKAGLETFIPGMIDMNPDITFLSTGGTFNRIKEILCEKADGRLRQVADYTGQPETQGGLVKTLDFRIYLGLLTETYNESHQKDLKRTSSLTIDMVVTNLYPFKETIAQKGATCENARGNIDIGGPTMIRAAAKNFIRVASVVDPLDYPMIIEEMNANGSMTSLELRYNLSKKAFDHTAVYDRTIADFLGTQAFNTVKKYYERS
jgi:phosphoribosylaminoimidazolecarboxamide formyltransferase/IMP cyclohydrolase